MARDIKPWYVRAWERILRFFNQNQLVETKPKPQFKMNPRPNLQLANQRQFTMFRRRV